LPSMLSNTRYPGNAKTNDRARWQYFYNSANNLNFTVNGLSGQHTCFPLVSFAENLLIQQKQIYVSMFLSSNCECSNT
jgi:hypothetical protein